MSMSMLNKIVVSEEVSRFPALRNSADMIFELVESSPHEEVIIDFSNVECVTASFAHQFINNLKRCNKKVRMINMNENVRKIFQIVENRKSLRAPIHPKKEEIPIFVL